MQFFKFKEVIFIVPDCFFALEFLIKNKLISINEKFCTIECSECGAIKNMKLGMKKW